MRTKQSAMSTGSSWACGTRHVKNYQACVLHSSQRSPVDWEVVALVFFPEEENETQQGEVPYLTSSNSCGARI